MKRFCKNVRATDVAVLDLDQPGSSARGLIIDECRRALDEDGSDAIVLGCAGMVELCAEIEDTIGAPVVEGVTAAVKWVEALVALRLATAKRGDYARPLAKRYDGAFARFSPTQADPHGGALRVNASAAAASVTPGATASAPASDKAIPAAHDDAAPHIHPV
jgi:allantoin racemase